ncbi:MAG: hypothetical protein ABSB35_10105 [Bryobacteraceae bacterium]|jgi:hypothetical protein
MPQKLTNEIIAAAIAGFEAQKKHIDSQIAELREMLNGKRTEKSATPEGPAPKRKVSAAARRRMALGQKRRWAMIKGQSEAPQSAGPKKAAVKKAKTKSPAKAA